MKEVTRKSLGALVPLVILLALQAVVTRIGGSSWTESLLPFVIGCSVLVPFCLFVLPRRTLALGVAFWLIGVMFVCLPFGMCSSTFANTLVAPHLASVLTPWLAPRWTNLAVFVAAYLVGLVSGALVLWAAWRELPLRRRAA